MKKQTLFALLSTLLAVSCFSFGIYECMDSHNSALMKCLSVYNDERRLSCFWGVTETLKASLESAAKDKTSPMWKAEILSVGFFRNERNIISTGEEFAVGKTGTYFLSVANGNPLDKKSRAERYSLSLWDGEKMTSLGVSVKDDCGLEKELSLETGKNYTIIVDELAPVASYITTIVSDRKLAVE